MAKNDADKDTKPRRYNIQIDRVHFVVDRDTISGAELRSVPSPPIGPERDLFEVIPGNVDRKIDSDTVVEITNGKRFFTAPGHINPGCFTGAKTCPSHI